MELEYNYQIHFIAFYALFFSKLIQDIDAISPDTHGTIAWRYLIQQ